MKNEFVLKNEYAGMEDFAFEMMHDDTVESSTYLAALKCPFNSNLYYCSATSCCTKPQCAGHCALIAE